ncbi:MAG: hypothetical protein FWF33_05780 [Clostridiales bacterium]|nr:hypothetical protein [Clostridiales bacterium]
MKQFIVLAAILPILLLFFAQSSLDRLNDRRTELAESAIRAFERNASFGGGDITAEADCLRARLTQIFGVEEREVRLELTSSGDGPQVRYRIAVPMGNLMAGGALLGLNESQNRGVFTFEGEILDVRAATAAILEEERARTDETEPDPAESDDTGDTGEDAEDPGDVIG